MTKLNLSIAVGDYDRIRPLLDGAVRIDGVDPTYLVLDVQEMFFRALRHAEFDATELSLSSYAVQVARGDCPYVGLPVFLSRSFRHTSFFIRTDRGIASPADLKGRRIGTPEYQMTASVWVRAMLEEDYGVRPRDIIWVRGGVETPGRDEKVALALPPGLTMEQAPPGATLSGMLSRGEIDGILVPRAPSCFERGEPNIGWLFPDPEAAARDYYARTRIFPIMHLLGLRRDLVEKHPWLPGSLQKAFTAAKDLALTRLTDISATKVTLPFVEELLRGTRKLMGHDFWSYGLAPNRDALATFLRHHHAQGLSQRLLAPEELFHPASLEAFTI